MIWHRGAKRITASERAHMETVRRLGCICCAQFGVVWLAPVHIHHILSGHKRMGHTWVLPLCSPHHVGSPFTLYQEMLIPIDARVSIASGSKAFAKVYGTERELYEGVCRKLELTPQWPETKILPRRLA